MIVGWSKKLKRLVRLPRGRGDGGVLEVHYPHVGEFSRAPKGMMEAVIKEMTSTGKEGVQFRPAPEHWDPGR